MLSLFQIRIECILDRNIYCRFKMIQYGAICPQLIRTLQQFNFWRFMQLGSKPLINSFIKMADRDHHVIINIYMTSTPILYTIPLNSIQYSGRPYIFLELPGGTLNSTFFRYLMKDVLRIRIHNRIPPYPCFLPKRNL